MRIVKWAALYCILIGISMIGVWTMLYLNNEIPELATTPIAIGMHITAEIVTGVLLIVGGLGLILQKTWGFQMYMFSMGMLVYTLIQSPGYYAQKGEYAFVAMFAVCIILAVVIIIASFIKRDQFKRYS